MGAAEILALVFGALKLAKEGASLYEKIQSGEEPTAAEVAALKARQRTAEERWAEVLAGLTEGGE